MSTPTNQAERIGDKVVVRDVVLWDLATFERDRDSKLARYSGAFADASDFATSIVANTNADIDAGLFPQIVIEHADVRSQTEPAVGRIAGRLRIGTHPKAGAAIVADIEYPAVVFDKAVGSNAYPRRSVEMRSRSGKPRDIQISAVALLSGRLPGARVPDVYFAVSDGDGAEPTAAMRAESKRGLEWRRKHGRGGTDIGVARARDIANGRRLSLDTISRMRSYFARHAVDKQGSGWKPGSDGYPSAGRIAWALWGGDAGERFANARPLDNVGEVSMNTAEAIKTLIHGLSAEEKRALFVDLGDMVDDGGEAKPEDKPDAAAKPVTYAADPVLTARVAQSDAAVNSLKSQLDATNAKLRRAEVQQTLATLAAEGVEFATDTELSYLCGVDEPTAQAHIQRMRTNYRRSVAGSVIGAAPVLVAQFASDDAAPSKFKAATEKAAVLKGNK